MENLSSLAEVQLKDPKIRNIAREQQKKLDEKEKLMRKFAIESMVQYKEATPAKKRKRIEDTIEEYEKETQEYEKKIVRMEEMEAARHAQLLDQAKETTRAVSELCQL